MLSIKKLAVNPSVKSLERENWTELNEFHRVMSQTFHPSERGDFEPIRTRSGEMVDKAYRLQKGVIPASFRTTDIHRAIEDLVGGSAILHQLIMKNADDMTIAMKLNELHDAFHVIQGICRH